MDVRTDIIDGVKITATLESGHIVEIAARPDDDRLWTGDTVTATVARYAPAQKAYFLKYHDVDILLPSKEKLKDGQSVTVTIERPATNEKHARAVISPSGAFGIDPKDQGSQNERNLEEFDTQILALLDRRVDCGNGINIVIDEAEAATVIDVNAASPDLSPLEANRIAASEIFRQMRLRNLQGQILIDFLRLAKQEDKDVFALFLADLAKADPRPVSLYGFTRLGLFELTREKHGLSLKTVFSLVK